MSGAHEGNRDQARVMFPWSIQDDGTLGDHEFVMPAERYTRCDECDRPIDEGETIMWRETVGTLCFGCFVRMSLARIQRQP